MSRPQPNAKPKPATRRQWHRLFGLIVEDMVGAAGKVEIEADLSRQRQLLDVAVVILHSAGKPTGMPDGFGDFVRFNLITYKSHHEILDGWAIRELIGHFVNYRKQASGRGRLLPEEQFRLYAVSAHRPDALFAALPPLVVCPGVYDIRYGLDVIRVVVACELPWTPNNAGALLFSAREDAVEYGDANFRPHAEASGVLNQLRSNYVSEGLTMAYTLKQFNRELLAKMPLDERLEGITPEQMLSRLKPEQLLSRLKPEQLLSRLKPEQRVEGLKPEQRLEGLKLEQRLEGLKPEELEQLEACLAKARHPAPKKGKPAR